MKDTFLHELQDAYDAEHQFLQALGVMSSKAQEPTLLKGLQKHIGETEQQIKVLEQVFAELGESAKRQPCDGAKGLVSEAEKMIAEAQVNEIRDSLIGSAASKAESYEVNAYTGMVASAELMGETKVARLLQRNLRQEERMQAALERREETLLKRALKSTGELATASRR
jgi:ferritin-like metal-binding protein YciE